MSELKLRPPKEEEKSLEGRGDEEEEPKTHSSHKARRMGHPNPRGTRPQEDRGGAGW